MSSIRKVVFSGRRRAEIALEARSSSPLGPRQVRLRTLVSGISRGTELAIYRGEASFFEKAYNPTLQLFENAQGQTWTYPIEFGYENVGRVEAVGAGVSEFRPGETVITYSPHREEVLADIDARDPLLGNICPVLPLPAGVAPENGVFVPLLGVALNAMLDAQVLLTETVVIFGAGVVGLLMLQLARQSGAGAVYVVEPSSVRRQFAERLGADRTFDPASGTNVARAVRELTDGRGADVALEASGTHRGLQQAVRVVGYNGRVIASSWINGPATDLCLGEEFHLNRVRIFSSQSAGTNPLLADRWNNARRTRATLALLPKLKLDGLITHRFTVDQAAEAFALVDRNPDQVLQVILTYGGAQ